MSDDELSPEAEAALTAGLDDARAGRVRRWGDFTRYLSDSELRRALSHQDLADTPITFQPAATYHEFAPLAAAVQSEASEIVALAPGRASPESEDRFGCPQLPYSFLPEVTE